MARQFFYIGTIQDKFSDGLGENGGVDVVVLLHQLVNKSTYIEIRSVSVIDSTTLSSILTGASPYIIVSVLDGKLVGERLLKFFIGNPGFYISSSLAAICFILERERWEFVCVKFTPEVIAHDLGRDEFSLILERLAAETLLDVADLQAGPANVLTDRLPIRR